MLQNNSLLFSIQINIQWNLSSVWYLYLIGHQEVDIAGVPIQNKLIQRQLAEFNFM